MATLMREQYVQRTGINPLYTPGRPTSDFTSAMPPTFFHPLLAIVVKSMPEGPLTTVRDVPFDDISPISFGLPN